jgi:hypothetical protein
MHGMVNFTIFRQLLVRIAEDREILSIVGDPVKIWSRHLPDTSQKHYGWSQLAWCQEEQQNIYL